MPQRVAEASFGYDRPNPGGKLIDPGSVQLVLDKDLMMRLLNREPSKGNRKFEASKVVAGKNRNDRKRDKCRPC